MSTIYDYVMAVWLELDLPNPAATFADELHDYLVESGFQINEFKVIEDDDDANGKVTVSLRIQLTFDDSQMYGDEPTSEAVAKFDQELRTCLSSKYEVNYLDVMDDSPHSCLLGKRDDPEPRKYPESKLRDLTEAEKLALRARIERGDADIYALADEFGCSASQVAGIKAAMHR